MICVPIDLDKEKAAREERIGLMGCRLVDAISPPFAQWLTRECVAGPDSGEVAEALARVLDAVIDGAARHIAYCAAREDLVPLIRADVVNRVTLRIAAATAFETKETVGHG